MTSCRTVTCPNSTPFESGRARSNAHTQMQNHAWKHTKIRSLAQANANKYVNMHYLFMNLFPYGKRNLAVVFSLCSIPLPVGSASCNCRHPDRLSAVCPDFTTTNGDSRNGTFSVFVQDSQGKALLLDIVKCKDLRAQSSDSMLSTSFRQPLLLGRGLSAIDHAGDQSACLYGDAAENGIIRGGTTIKHEQDALLSQFLSLPHPMKATLNAPPESMPCDRRT